MTVLRYKVSLSLVNYFLKVLSSSFRTRLHEHRSQRQMKTHAMLVLFHRDLEAGHVSGRDHEHAGAAGTWMNRIEPRAQRNCSSRKQHWTMHWANEVEFAFEK